MSVHNPKPAPVHICRRRAGDLQWREVPHFRGMIHLWNVPLGLTPSLLSLSPHLMAPQPRQPVICSQAGLGIQTVAGGAIPVTLVTHLSSMTQLEEVRRPWVMP